MVMDYNRYELKYIIRWKEYQDMLLRLSSLTRPDGYATGGKYKILSLYYDNKDLQFYWEKVDGYDNRLKVRLRYYGNPSDDEDVFVEIKEKDNQAILKRRGKIGLQDAYTLFSSEALEKQKRKKYGKQAVDVFDEVSYLHSLYRLQPQIMVSYVRQPLVGLYDPRLRVTFDTLLRYYDGRESFQPGKKELFAIHPDFVILEIKVAETVPQWLLDIIGHYELSQQRVSKYCLAIDQMYSKKNFLS